MGAALTRGRRSCDPYHILSEKDFVSWPPIQFDSFHPSSDWALGPTTRASVHIETRIIKTQHCPCRFDAVYGYGHLSGRTMDVEGIRALRVRGTRSIRCRASEMRGAPSIIVASKRLRRSITSCGYAIASRAQRMIRRNP